MVEAVQSRVRSLPLCTSCQPGTTNLSQYPAVAHVTPPGPQALTLAPVPVAGHLSSHSHGGLPAEFAQQLGGAPADLCLEQPQRGSQVTDLWHC